MLRLMRLSKAVRCGYRGCGGSLRLLMLLRSSKMLRVVEVVYIDKIDGDVEIVDVTEIDRDVEIVDVNHDAEIVDFILRLVKLISFLVSI